MAIFSQLDEKTKYDFRNYNHGKPNRNIPYKLPEDIKEKVLKYTKEDWEKYDYRQKTYQVHNSTKTIPLCMENCRFT